MEYGSKRVAPKDHENTIKGWTACFANSEQKCRQAGSEEYRGEKRVHLLRVCTPGFLRESPWYETLKHDNKQIFAFSKLKYGL